MAEFPTRPEEVTPAWIAEALDYSGDAAIEQVSWQPIGTGQVGDSARFALEWSEPGTSPATLAGKFPAADETSRNTAALFGLYRKEVEFYRDFAPRLDVRVPRTHAACVDDEGRDFILLFEDLGPARGGNQLESCTLDEACHAVRQAAALHGPSWKNAAMLEAAWIQPPPDLGSQIAALYPQAHAFWQERYGDLLEPELMQVCNELAESCDLWFHRGEAPQCIIHGDFRLDNMLFDIRDGAEPIAILDWQTVATGNAMTDIGYFLGCGIGDDLRRAHETELLDLYRAEMDARGVTFDDAEFWQDYRIGALHGVSTAVFSAAFVERTERGDRNFLSMARGACALALEHGSIAALKERY